MDSKQFNIIKTLDIAFEINDIYKKYHTKNNYYYYSAEKNSYNIINVVFDQKKYVINKKDIKKIKDRMKRKHYIDNFKILIFIIGDQSSQLEVDKDISLIFVTYQNWKNELSKIISNIDFSAEFDIMKAYEEQKDNLKNNNQGINLDSNIGRKYRSFEYKKQISNLPVFIFLLIFTVIMPIIINIFWTISNFQKGTTSEYTLNYFLMLFGAANHDLMICLNQWWRAITYPMISYGLFNSLWDLIVLFFFVRYLEIAIGHKQAFVLIALYPFIGIIESMVSFSSVISGPAIIYALLFGGAMVSIYKKNDYASLIIRRKIIFAIILFLIISLVINKGIVNDIFILFALVVGCSYGLFVNHNYKQKDWLIYIPIIIFSIFALATIGFILVGEFSKFLPPQNQDVLDVTNTYIKLHILKPDALTRLKNYYTY